MTSEQLLHTPAECDLCGQGTTLHPIGAAGLTIRADRVLVPCERPYQLCMRCGHLLDPALRNAVEAAQRALPRKGRPTNRQLRKAYESAFAQGEWLEGAIVGIRGRGPGAPRKLARDFAIHVLFFLGVPDSRLGELFGKDARYAKDRRRLSAFHAHEWQRTYHRG
jgi:hypothetical protein